jgi:FkbM family methyltransferase
MEKLMETFLNWMLLKTAKGVIHVGANSGRERNLYKRYKVRVVWIEPLSEAFRKLKRNIRHFPMQKAYRALVTDVDNKKYQFGVSNNHGASSSIFKIKLHRKIWPKVRYKKTIELKSITLKSFIIKNKIDMKKYDTLVLDTQGAELLVLKGASPFLEYIRFVKVEAATFESYSGCCQLIDVAEFLEKNGFQEISRHEFAWHAGVGSYYNVVYERKSNAA